MGAGAERIALDIQATANVAEVAKARSEVSALGEAARKAGEEKEIFNRVLKETNNNMIAAAKAVAEYRQQQERATVAVGEAAEAIGTSPARGLTGSFGGLQSKANAAGIATLFAFESIARGAQSAEGPARAAARSLSMLALALGPEVGIPIAGALALGDALVEMWTRSAKAAANARMEFEKTLETVGRQGFAASSAELQSIYSGDPFARRGAVKDETELQFRIRRDGLRGLQVEMAKLQAIQQDNTDAWDRAQIKIRALQPVLDEQNRRYQEALALQRSGLAVVENRARFELQMMRERAALRTAQRLRPEEVPLTIGNLADQERAFGITGAGGVAGLGVRGVSSLDLSAAARDRSQRVDATGLGRIRPAELTETPFHAMQVEMLKQIDALGAATQRRLGNTLADSLAAGITAGFKGGGVSGAFKAAGKALLAGLGGIFIDLGKTYLEYSGIMQALTPLLGNPFTAGYAGAAIGAALIGLGAALEGVGQRERGGGAGNNSVFVPNAVGGAGGTTVIIQTVDPFSRAVVNATTYYINRGGMLNTPIVAPFGAPS